MDKVQFLDFAYVFYLTSLYFLHAVRLNYSILYLLSANLELMKTLTMQKEILGISVKNCHV